MRKISTKRSAEGSPHHVRLQTGHQLTDAGLQTVLHPLHLLQGRVGEDLRRDGRIEKLPADRTARRSGVRSAAAATFWILVFMADGMVVGGTNWKVGAALLGYWAGNFTTRWTRWLPKWADTTQLRFRASICGTQDTFCLHLRSRPHKQLGHKPPPRSTQWWAKISPPH